MTSGWNVMCNTMLRQRDRVSPQKDTDLIVWQRQGRLKPDQVKAKQISTWIRSARQRSHSLHHPTRFTQALTYDAQDDHTRAISLDSNLCPWTVFSLTWPSPTPTHRRLHSLPYLAELSLAVIMSSSASCDQHQVEGGYCCQCHPCHAPRGKCPAFSFHSFAALKLHDVVIEPL